MQKHKGAKQCKECDSSLWAYDGRQAWRCSEAEAGKLQWVDGHTSLPSTL